MKKACLLPCLLFAVIFVFLTGCREPQDLQFRSVKNLSVDDLGFNQSTLNAELVYYNPNNFGLELKRTDLAIYVDSTLLGHSVQDFQVKIPKREEFTLPLKINLDMKNLLKNSLFMLLNKEISLHLVGKVKVGKAGVFKSFPIDYRTVQRFSLFD